MFFHNFTEKLIIIFILPFIIPLCIVIYFIIKIEGYSPIFKQKRLGIYKVPFTLYKFRSMKPNAPEKLTHECSEKYFLKCAPFLRSFKLDELPQFINILNGSMSLIGPRPGLINDQNLIKERQKRNLYNFLPGITGYSQIMNACMDDPEKLANYDVLTIKLKNNFIVYIIILITTIFSSKRFLKNFLTEYVRKTL